ncbi:MAG: helix-turn-helix domain-containing protein [Rhodobacterales bacterium]|uniref:IclR family transcriptional regulator n=1 Tax=Sulfitobacter sp. HI0054 TaxID=1822238 RepID=UPI000B0BA0AB|nr:IclR family transcriptional regulator C-terminal domain-containing protein [Sulfitobacter sp. HI0054]MDX5411432.1 helix-turn-helix domain-containing protein [Rhodobacterales bacterium]
MGTIRKVGDVLRLFSVNEPELGLSDISRRMGMSTSGCHDLMDGLRKIGMVSRVGRGRYRLGPMISSLYRVLIDTSALVDTARPTLERLVEDYGETVFLTVLDRSRLVVADAIEGRKGLRVSRGILDGDILVHETPVGMLHLSVAGKARQEAYFDAHSGARTPLLPPDRRDAELEAMAEKGLAMGPIATERDVICVAALLRNHTEIPFAALSICVPKSRFDEQPRAFMTIAQTAATRISADLGMVVG